MNATPSSHVARKPIKTIPRMLCLLLPLCFSGCAIVAVADAAVTVTASAVKIGATVVETAVDVTAAGARAMVGTDAADAEKN
jgi:hypothetical protein